MYTFTEDEKVRLLEWAHELETTGLLQTTRRLREESGFCCLGIYCNMRDPSRWASDGRGNYHYTFGKDFKYINTSELPPDLLEELGIERFRLDLKFIAMNDMYKLSFKEIAQEIYRLLEFGSFSRNYYGNV